MYLPFFIQLGVPLVVVVQIINPSLVTHQHCPVLPEHCTVLKLPSCSQSGMNTPGGTRKPGRSRMRLLQRWHVLNLARWTGQTWEILHKENGDFTTLHYHTPHRTALYCTTLHHTTSHQTTLPYPSLCHMHANLTLHHSKILDHTALHYIAQLCSVMHCTITLWNVFTSIRVNKRCVRLFKYCSSKGYWLTISILNWHK